LLAYLAVQGGALMALGFVLGIVLPLAVITGLAVREAIVQGDIRRK
jgi:thiosulfate reductase cytochrome b subunit